MFRDMGQECSSISFSYQVVLSSSNTICLILASSLLTSNRNSASMVSERTLYHLVLVSFIQFELHAFVLAVSHESALLFNPCFVLYCHISDCYLQTPYGLNPILSRLVKRHLFSSHRLFLVSALPRFLSSVVGVSPVAPWNGPSFHSRLMLCARTLGLSCLTSPKAVRSYSRLTLSHHQPAFPISRLETHDPLSLVSLGLTPNRIFSRHVSERNFV